MRAKHRTRLVVLFGGRSAEHEVSCVTAVHVLKGLDPARYDVVPVGITPDGRWVAADGVRALMAEAGPGALPEALEATGRETTPEASLVPMGPGAEGPTVVLPLLHGPFGEDGTVQGLLELAGVAYVGSGVLGSAVCMDKLTAKQLLAAAGLPQCRHFGLRERGGGARAIAERVEAELGWPVFVKPANLGSSVGVTKAEGPEQLAAAIDVAVSFDEWVLVEEAVRGREIEVAVLGDLDPEASVPGEVRPSHEFYDYEDKYVDGAAELVIPAELPDDVAAEVRRLAVAAFTALRAEGLARVDFFYEEGARQGGPPEGTVPGRGLLVNEVNTMPGFTPISMYPKLWEASGVPYAELLDRLVTYALARHERRSGRIGRGR